MLWPWTESALHLRLPAPPGEAHRPRRPGVRSGVHAWERLHRDWCAPFLACARSSSVAPVARAGSCADRLARLHCAGSADQTVRLWSVELGRCLHAYRGHFAPVWAVATNPHGLYFASASNDCTARIWSVDNPETRRMIVRLRKPATPPVAPCVLFACALTPQGEVAAAAQSCPSHACYRHVQVHDADVDCVTWHNNGAYLATGEPPRLQGLPERLAPAPAVLLPRVACHAVTESAPLQRPLSLVQGRRIGPSVCGTFRPPARRPFASCRGRGPLPGACASARTAPCWRRRRTTDRSTSGTLRR